LSWLNVLELTRPSAETFSASERLFLEVFPRVVFVEVLPDVVIERENLVLNGKPAPGDPKLDSAMLIEFVGRTKGMVNPLDPRGFLGAFRSHREELRKMWQGVAGRIQARTKAARSSRTLPPEPTLIPTLPRPTRYVAWKATCHLVEQVNLEDVNNFPDYFHTVVPISTCDYVVLDKQWAEVARQVGQYLRRKGLPSLPGEVLRDEVELLERLEAAAP
jgi:hypothetical protein